MVNHVINLIFIYTISFFYVQCDERTMEAIRDMATQHQGDSPLEEGDSQSEGDVTAMRT